ncbi:hypothetical protein N0O92_06735 [Alkalihalobacillus sp. MEB130]|uniref:hypothetical protein n=1 Tax=Alkalihalobacillus sp. MEB130 TaxID=2976704 RepID=UPI0028DDBD3C|nr:hypothetical protein [Alkalihalobacillus sp. MEB130]MDT8859923.1 hypothetical protein [Alkalihalobacillus sp. MEB130]
MKKRQVLFVIGTSLVLASCGADSEEEIVHDVEAQQFRSDYHDTPAPPSIRDQNKQRVPRYTAMQSYADEAGHYISETAVLLEDLATFFDQGTVETSDVDETMDKIELLRNKGEEFINTSRPEPFDALHHVHVSTLMEIDALERILSDMKEPIHPLQVTNARVYYENAVLSHKLMEREYLAVTEDYGIH